MRYSQNHCEKYFFIDRMIEMFPKIFPIPPAQKESVEFERLKFNCNRLIPLSALIAVWELFLICATVYKRGLFQEGTYRYYFVAYAFNFLFNLIALVVSRHFRKRRFHSYKKLKPFGKILIGYVAVALAWSLYILYLDQCLAYKQVIAYVVSLVIVSSMLNLDPRTFFLLNCISTTVLLVILYETQDSAAIFFGNTVNLIVLIAFILLSHSMKYCSFYENELRKMEIERLSHEDALTGLRNRRSLQEYSEKYAESDKSKNGLLSAIMIDIDYFKKFNDRYGHDKGDLLLKGMGETLNAIQELYPAAAFRFGGEEFLVLCEAATSAQAKEIAEDIGERFKRQSKEPFWAGKEPVTISIGIAETNHISTPEELYHLITKADRALYQAKENGRDQIIVSQKG